MSEPEPEPPAMEQAEERRSEPEKPTVEQAEENRPKKLDPESFELRSRPARAIRFRRGAIIGAAAVASVSLTVVAWMALKPRLFGRVSQDSELSQPMVKPAEAVSGLPSSYGDVPKLGPALPGDLGRPILRAQQRATGEPLPPPRVDAEAKRQEQLAELKAARESGLLAQVSSSGSGVPASPTVPAPFSNAEPASSADGSATRKERFAETRDDRADLNSGSLIAPVSPNTIFAGSVIAASLITGLNSDLPGLVTAQVTQNVYDTVTGRTLLVPQGSRLIGKYDSVVAFGQSRALVIWQRLILPNGSSVRLDNMPASDAGGYAGLADKVDFHTWSLLKGVGLATMLGVGSELTIGDDSDLVKAIRESAQTNVSRAGDQITQRNLDIQPTITIRPGAPVRVLVTRDLIMQPVQEEKRSWPN